MRNKHRSGDVSVHIKTLFYRHCSYLFSQDETKPPPHQTIKWNRQKEIKRKECWRGEAEILARAVGSEVLLRWSHPPSYVQLCQVSTNHRDTCNILLPTATKYDDGYTRRSAMPETIRRPMVPRSILCAWDEPWTYLCFILKPLGQGGYISAT